MNLNRELIKDNSKLRLAARKQLKGNWGMAVLLILIYGIITVTVSSLGPRKGFFRLGATLSWILSGPLELGLTIALLTIVRTQTVKFEALFDGFKKFGQSFLTQLLRTIFIALWGIPATIISIFAFFNYVTSIYSMRIDNLDSTFRLLMLSALVASILPLIATLRYSMSFYILNDNAEISPIDALNKSKEMMKGFKGKLFLLYLSFIGWGILGTLTLGIGLLWVIPYIKTSEANFYENLKEAYEPIENPNLNSYDEI